MLKKKGFTLIEILLIITLLGILGVAALSSYINSSKTFNFLANYKSVMSVVRTARSYAITNKRSTGVDIPRYGIMISSNSVKLFADTGATPFEFNDGEDSGYASKNLNFAANSYSITPVGAGAGVVLPLYLFYETGSGELSVYRDNDQNPSTPVDRIANKFIKLKFSEEGNDLEKFITIFYVSGLVEESDL